MFENKIIYIYSIYPPSNSTTASPCLWKDKHTARKYSGFKLSQAVITDHFRDPTLDGFLLHVFSCKNTRLNNQGGSVQVHMNQFFIFENEHFLLVVPVLQPVQDALASVLPTAHLIRFNAVFGNNYPWFHSQIISNHPPHWPFRHGIVQSKLSQIPLDFYLDGPDNFRGLFGSPFFTSVNLIYIDPGSQHLSDPINHVSVHPKCLCNDLGGLLRAEFFCHNFANSRNSIFNVVIEKAGDEMFRVTPKVGLWCKISCSRSIVWTEQG